MVDNKSAELYWYCIREDNAAAPTFGRIWHYSEFLCTEDIVLQGGKQKIKGNFYNSSYYNFDQLVCTHRMEKMGFGVQPVVSQCD